MKKLLFSLAFVAFLSYTMTSCGKDEEPTDNNKTATANNNNKQPATPLKTDNKIAEAFVQPEMRHKRSKSWDMRLWRLKDLLVQKHFKIFWESGTQNWADYFTKHLAPKYH